MEHNYNLSRKKLMLPEYGRHVHEMVDFLSTIRDRDLRNIQALVVIEVMGNLNPTLRDTADFKHKLWDHLFIMSDFQLDVDSPYPIPTAEILYPKPDKMAYPNKKITRKYYGKNIEQMLLAIKDAPDESDKTLVVANLAKYMRAKVFEYNQEHPSNQAIIKDILEMSKNGIVLDESALNNIKSDYYYPQTSSRPHKNSGAGTHFTPKPTPRNEKQSGKRKWPQHK